MRADPVLTPRVDRFARESRVMTQAVSTTRCARRHAA